MPPPIPLPTQDYSYLPRQHPVDDIVNPSRSANPPPIPFGMARLEGIPASLPRQAAVPNNPMPRQHPVDDIVNLSRSANLPPIPFGMARIPIPLPRVPEKPTNPMYYVDQYARSVLEDAKTIPSELGQLTRGAWNLFGPPAVYNPRSHGAAWTRRLFGGPADPSAEAVRAYHERQRQAEQDIMAGASNLYNNRAIEFVEFASIPFGNPMALGKTISKQTGRALGTRRAVGRNLNTGGITAHSLNKSGKPDYHHGAVDLPKGHAPILSANAVFDVNQAGLRAFRTGRKRKHPFAAVVGDEVEIPKDLLKDENFEEVFFNPAKHDTWVDANGTPIQGTQEYALQQGNRMWIYKKPNPELQRYLRDKEQQIQQQTNPNVINALLDEYNKAKRTGKIPVGRPAKIPHPRKYPEGLVNDLDAESFSRLAEGIDNPSGYRFAEELRRYPLNEGMLSYDDYFKQHHKRRLRGIDDIERANQLVSEIALRNKADSLFDEAKALAKKMPDDHVGGKMNFVNSLSNLLNDRLVEPYVAYGRDIPAKYTKDVKDLGKARELMRRAERVPLALRSHPLDMKEFYKEYIEQKAYDMIDEIQEKYRPPRRTLKERMERGEGIAEQYGVPNLLDVTDSAEVLQRAGFEVSEPEKWRGENWHSGVPGMSVEDAEKWRFAAALIYRAERGDIPVEISGQSYYYGKIPRIIE